MDRSKCVQLPDECSGHRQGPNCFVAPTPWSEDAIAEQQHGLECRSLRNAGEGNVQVVIHWKAAKTEQRQWTPRARRSRSPSCAIQGCASFRRVLLQVIVCLQTRWG